MAEFLNEQEQLEVLKSFWRQYGRWLLSLVILAALGMGVLQIWQSHKAAQLSKASAAYETLLDEVNKKDDVAAAIVAQGIVSQYPHTPYASMAELFLASFNVNTQNYKAAEDNLHWIIVHSSTPAFKATASIRLSRILIAQGQAAKALDLLSHAPDGYIHENKNFTVRRHPRAIIGRMRCEG